MSIRFERLTEMCLKSEVVELILPPFEVEEH
jgi:hypothetical protein